MKKIPWSVPDLQSEDINAVMRVLNSGWYSMGPEVKKFEEEVSSYLGINYAVAVNSGTSALDVALKCIGVGEGDEVIIPALTYIATGNAVLYNNATPVFADIDETLNIDPSLVEDKITEKTKAIINIDFGGNPSDYSRLLKISREYNIPLIVDGAQSFGSEYNGKKCCTHGLINTTSFHAAKLLTTIEGGMIFTNDEEIFQKARCIRNQGETGKYYHEYLGNNYRMTDILAAIGNSQMDRIDRIIEMRREKAHYYRENLKNVEYPRELPNTKSNYFLFVILVDERDKLNHYLNRNGIETRITYPMPISEQPVFKKYSRGERFPVAEEVSRRVLSIPLHNKLSREEQDYIIEKINAFLG